MNSLNKMPFRIKAVGFVLMIVVGINLVYFLAYRPKIVQIIQTKAMVENLMAELSEKTRMELGFVAASAEEQQVWDEVSAELHRKIPATMELPRVLEDIASVARKAGIMGLTLTTLADDAEGGTGARQTVRIGGRTLSLTQQSDDPEAVNPLGDLNLRETTINLEFRCDYRDLAKFLEGLSSLPRFVLIRNLEIGRELPEMSVNMCLSVFSLEDDTARVGMDNPA